VKDGLPSCAGRSKGGFTLVEVVIVVFIIGVLAVMGIPSFVTARERSRENRAKDDLRVIAEAVQRLAFDTGMWPGGVSVQDQFGSEILDLNSATAGLLTDSDIFPGWKGPYTRRIRKDPWGQSYYFDPDYQIYGVLYAVVGSFGPNGRGQNVYDSDNIVVVVGRAR
jgi:general secretion pathway protein G